MTHIYEKKCWTLEEDNILRELVVDQDLPYDKAAKILGRGRAACISRGRRLGIKKGRRIRRPGSHLHTQKHPWRQQRLPEKYNTEHPQFRPGSPPPSPSGPPPLEPCLSHRPISAIAPTPKRLLDLEPSECRWPVGEIPRQDGIEGVETVFCGMKILKGRSYCTHHCDDAYVKKDQD